MKIFFYILFLLNTVQLWAQPFHYEIFDTQDGMLSSEITTLYQDKKGYLWIGTVVGLSRYDGYSFTNFTIADGLTSSFVRGIQEDKSGTLWVATHSGISFWNGQEFQAINYKKLGNELIWIFHITPNGDLWVGRDTGISVLRNKDLQKAKTNFQESSFHHFDLKVDVNAMASDSFGNVYFTDYQELMVYDGTDFKTLGTDEEDAITSIFPLDKDTVLVGNRAGSINKMAKDFKAPFQAYEKDSEDALTILPYDNRLWIQDQNGVKIIEHGKQIYNHSLYEVEGIKLLQCMIKDREHNFWLGSTEGLIKMTPRDFKMHQGVTDAIKNGVYSLIENEAGELVVGGNSKRNYIRKADGKYEKLKIPKHFPKGEMYDMIKDHNGDLWFLSYWDGLARYQSATQVDTFYYDHGITRGSDFYCVFEDQSYNIWLGHTAGASQLIFDWQADTLKQVINYIEDAGVSRGSVKSIIQDSHGTLWFGFTYGLYYYENGNLIKYKDLQVPIIDMVIDKDNSLWIATQGRGLLKWKITGEKQLELIEEYNQDKGLASNFLLSLALNQNDDLWVGTYVGFSVLKKQEEQYHIINYNPQDGLFKKAYQNISLFNDKNNIMWAATSMGLLSFDPSVMSMNTVEPTVNIKGLEKITGEKISLDNFPKDSLLILGYDDNTLTFSYTGISLKNPTKIKYQYQLEGLSDRWSTLSSQREITFNNLNDGTYTLKVKACNNDFIWSTQPATFTFKIRAPFWETWWFISIAILTLTFLIAFVTNEYKNKQLNKQRFAILQKEQEMEQLKALIAGEEKERKRISQELHDGLGAVLATVKMRISSISDKSPTIIKNDNYLKAEELIDEACQTVRDISHRMTPYILEQNGLEYAISELCLTISQTQKIEIHFNPYQIDLIESDTLNITIYRVTQELVKNIIKHAEATEVIVQVTVEDENIEVLVEDDGKGFDINQVKGGIGLDNIRSRVEYLKGSLIIESEINRGTTFLINLPLK
ncbi:MAG: two-component regulator propeller domain-containing protein [Saprospiraceae bacterium]